MEEELKNLFGLLLKLKIKVAAVKRLWFNKQRCLEAGKAASALEDAVAAAERRSSNQTAVQVCTARHQQLKDVLDTMQAQSKPLQLSLCL
jgi:hypothetical protein